MVMIPSRKTRINMDKQTTRSITEVEALVRSAGPSLAGGAFTISAGDSYFEISKNLEIFTELYKELNIYYVDDTQPGKLMKTGIDAMLNSLDPYTQYIPESDMEDYRFMTTGQYGGIGALIKRQDDKVFISEPYEGYPAMKAGIWAGDEIVEVDGRKIVGHEHGGSEQVAEGTSREHGECDHPAQGMEPVTHASAPRRDQDPGRSLQGHDRSRWARWATSS